MKKSALLKSKPNALKMDEFKNIPEEVLIKIFEFLSVSDRCVAGLVCQTWFTATNCAKFMDEICVTMEESKRVLKLFANSSRNLTNFHFCEHNLNKKDYQNLWTKISPRIKSLSLRESFINGEKLVHCFKTAPSLTLVKLFLMPRYITDDWKLEHFAQIKANNCVKDFAWMDEASFIPDNLLIGFMQAFKDLESIRLLAKPVLETMSDEEFAGQQRHVCMECVHEEAHVDTVVRFLEKNAGTLKRLVLDEQKNWRTSYIPAFLQAKITMNHLTELNLCNNCHNMPTARHLDAFLVKHTQLKILHLKHVRIESSTLQVIFNQLTGLETLRLYPNFDHNDFNEELTGMRQLRELKEVHLFGFPSLTNQVFNTTMFYDLSRLQILTVAKMPLVTEKTFGKLLAQLTDLRQLAVIDCPKVATDKNLQVLFESCLRLESLFIGNSCSITERGFNGNFRISRLKSLKKLELLGLENLNDSCLMHLRCPVLRAVRISGTKGMTFKSVTQVMMQNPSLELFHLPTEDLAMMASIVGKKIMKRFKDINYAH